MSLDTTWPNMWQVEQSFRMSKTDLRARPMFARTKDAIEAIVRDKFTHSENEPTQEERFREAKHGAGLNHLPSADRGVNAVWAWAGLLAGALTVMLQTLTGLDTRADAPGRWRIATLRHQLLKLPGRVTSHAREQVLRLQPRQHLLAAVLARLRALPAPT